MDNPRKKKEDGKRVSQQPHEQAYQKRKNSKNSGGRSEQRSRAGSAPGSRASSGDRRSQA